MFELRPYQHEAVNTAIWYLRNYKKPFVIQAATGAGKSLIIAEICHKIGEPVLVLQPSKEILEQNYAKLMTYQIDDVKVFSASKNRKEVGRYTYATIGSIFRKPELFKHFKYVIIDECHLVDPKNLNSMYKTFLDAIGCTNVCGLTATPYRICQKYIWEGGNMYYTAALKMINRITKEPFFKKIAYKIETVQLIKEKYLSPIEYYVDRLEWSELQLNSTGRDFTDESLEKFWNNNRLRRIAQAAEYAAIHHKRCLIFCSSLRQASSAMTLCEALGLMCSRVDGKTPTKEREQAIVSFRNGDRPIMFNVGVFTTGFDVPTLDCVVLARPTMSLALYYQMIGRGVRLDPENPTKVLKVYDLAGVVERMGRVENIKVQTESGGFKDEVWTEHGRADEKALFKFFVKAKEKLESDNPRKDRQVTRISM